MYDSIIFLQGLNIPLEIEIIVEDLDITHVSTFISLILIILKILIHGEN